MKKQTTENISDMMKKPYLTPHMTLVKVNMQPVLSGSVIIGIQDSEDEVEADNAAARRKVDIWDDDEEEEDDGQR
jgi:hypothetical protein